jgi:Phage integrase family
LRRVGGAQRTPLDRRVVDVSRGIWLVLEPVIEESREPPTFHEFASEWFARKQAEGLTERTLEDYRWALEIHLLPFFAAHALSTILEWRDVNLAKGSLRVRRSKSEAGVRTVDIPRALAEELAEHKAAVERTAATDWVFPTSRGTPQTRQNIRRRVLLPAIGRANQALVELGTEPIGSVSPHGLRRTFASLLEACGDPPFLHGPADRAHGLPVHPERVRAVERPPGQAPRGRSESLRRGPPMGTNGHK